jgi:hypothetical protein
MPTVQVDEVVLTVLQEVGNRALESLVAVLQHDAPHDVDSAKAALETLMQLCETAEKVRPLGMTLCSHRSRQRTISVLFSPTDS